MEKFSNFIAQVKAYFAEKPLRDKKTLIIELLLKDNSIVEIIDTFNEIELETCKFLAEKEQQNKMEAARLKEFLKN